MIVTEIISGTKGRETVCLDSGLSFPIYKKEAAQFHIEEGAVLSEEEWQRLRAEVLDQRAAKRALYLLERMDRTEHQLREKLRDNGYPEEVVDSAVAYVASYHYIDDFRYACAYIHCRQERESRHQIKARLLRRGISERILNEAFEEEYRADELPMIEHFLEKKHYDPSTADYKEKKRLYSSLMRRGFRAEKIREAMRLS